MKIERFGDLPTGTLFLSVETDEVGNLEDIGGALFLKTRPNNPFYLADNPNYPNCVVVEPGGKGGRLYFFKGTTYQVSDDVRVVKVG